jgi:hypothetical protein
VAFPFLPLQAAWETTFSRHREGVKGRLGSAGG